MGTRDRTDKWNSQEYRFLCNGRKSFHEIRTLPKIKRPPWVEKRGRQPSTGWGQNLAPKNDLIQWAFKFPSILSTVILFHVCLPMWRSCCTQKHHAKGLGEAVFSLGLSMGEINWILREKKIRRVNLVISMVQMSVAEVCKVFLNHYSISHRNTVRPWNFLWFITRNSPHAFPCWGTDVTQFKAPGSWAPGIKTYQ